MGEFTYFVFTVVAALAAVLITAFAAGVGMVLLLSPVGAQHRVELEAAPHQAERYAA